MKQLNVAILGQGRSGRSIHGDYLITVPHKYKVTHVVEPIPERRDIAKNMFGCAVHADYTELFGATDIDFVVNATPSHLHVPITTDLIRHGFHVLTEKPFAQTAQQVDDMIALAEKHGRMLAIFQQSRFAPYFEQVKSVIASGVLGRLVQISVQFNGFARRWDWQCCQEYGGGNLYNTGPHPVDQALDLMNLGDVEPQVFCKMDRANTFGDAEDYVKLILTAPDRPVTDVEISSCDAYPTFTYRLMGTQGGLKGNMTQIDWRYFLPADAPQQKLIRTPLKDEAFAPLYCSEKLFWYEQSWHIGDASTFTLATGRLYDTVYNHLTQGTPLVVTPQQVRRQIAVMEEAHRQNPLSRLE